MVPSWGHFWHFRRPSWAKFGPKHVLKAYPCQKRELSPNTMNSNTGALIVTPRWPPKCLKIGPRRPQEGLEDDFCSLLKIVLILDSSWVRFWWIFPKTPPKKVGDAPPRFDLDIVRFSCYVAHHFKRLQEPPKRTQDPPKSAPRGSKRPPRAP